MVPGSIDECVFVYPADSGRIGTERRSDTLRQSVTDIVEVLEYSRPRPIHVGAFFEDYVNEGQAEERESPYYFGKRHREHCRRKRISDLILDDLRRLARILGKDDDLNVREIRYRVERCRPHCPGADGYEQDDEHCD